MKVISIRAYNDYQFRNVKNFKGIARDPLEIG